MPGRATLSTRAGTVRLPLDNAGLTIAWQIVQLGWATEQDTPKSEAGNRQLALDAGTVIVLRHHRRRQLTERLALGPAWPDTGLVFTAENGAALHPAFVTDHFHELADEIGLPPIRLHDLRHFAATITLAGADMKVVQEMLGHASYSFTADTYTSVLPEMAREAAEAAARLIPRSPKLSGTSRAHRTGGYRSPGVCRRVESAGVVMG